VEYSDNYKICAEEAERDFNNNARPELDEYLQESEKYDTIYLAYPNYCNTMPMVVFTFLEEYGFEGKTIKPICTNGGSGLGTSVRDIKKKNAYLLMQKNFASVQPLSIRLLTKGL